MTHDDKNNEDFPVYDDGFDEYELYYGKDAPRENFEVKIRTPDPLSRRPLITSSVPFFLLAICAVLATYMHTAGYHEDLLWASRETVFKQHQYWRLFTALFVHADAVHLLSNMPLFFFFGLFLYEYFGFLLFPLMSLVVGAAANAVTLYTYSDPVRLIGASGMVYAMAAIWLVLYIYHDTDYTIPTRIFRSIAFALVVLFPTTYNPTTSYLVHAAGFGLGTLFALISIPFTKVRIRD